MTTMSSPPPSGPPPSQETFEMVFNLHRHVEPDCENHITSSFGVLDINNDTLALGSSITGNTSLEIYTSRRRRFKKLLGKNDLNNITAQSDSGSDSVYEGNINMTCFSLATGGISTGSNLDHDLVLSPAPQENNYPAALARDSIATLSDSRVKNQLLPDSGNSSSSSFPSTQKQQQQPSSIYSHSLLQPIYVPVIRGRENRCSYYHHQQQENRHR